MTKKFENKRRQSFSDEVKTRVKKLKPALPLPSSNKDKTYTKKELEEIQRIRQMRYNDLLNSARTGDMAAVLVLPGADPFEVPMSRVSRTLDEQVEILDIYHYLEKRKTNLPYRLSQRSFGPTIGLDLSCSSLQRMLKRENEIRAAAKRLPSGSHYIVNRRTLMLEQVLLHWLHNQRKKNVPASGKMKNTAYFACTVLCDLEDESGDTASEAPLSFSAWWFDSILSQHHITYCQLQREAGSVDLEAIEPELVEIRRLCTRYSPDNIFSCDETGFYLKELDTRSYTTPLSRSGAKAFRECKVSVLFCINASGTSLSMAKTKRSLKPLVIAQHFAREVEEGALSEMTIARTQSGWMNHTIFADWLSMLDDDLSEPALLLLDSATAHDNIEMRDPEKGIPWRHLCIQRLPKNSTSVTQPLDAGVISVFKRAFLEMLGYETNLVRNFAKPGCIANSRAWTLIPYAWNRVKASTLRNCFAKTPVLPMEMREELWRRLPSEDEPKLNLQYIRHLQHKEQMKIYFEHLIARVSQEDILDIRKIENMEEITDEALHQVAVKENKQDGNLGEEVGCDTSSSHDGSASSPIDDVDLDATIQTLKTFAGDNDVLTIDGLKQITQRAGQGVRKSVKEFVRACSGFQCNNC